MTANSDLLEALQLPAASSLGKRVPKKLLLERGAPTAADKRKIQDGIEAIHWLSSLKPNNLNIPPLKNERHDYSEIAVLQVELREKAKIGRLVELIHRAIPYPVALIATQQGKALLSLANKRRSEAEADKFVLEQSVDSTGLIDSEQKPIGYTAFLSDLATTKQSRTDLHAFYQSWIRRILALQTATIKGTYSSEIKDVANVREALDSRSELLEEVASLRAAAKKEKQINRQVELNLEIKRLETALNKQLAHL